MPNGEGEKICKKEKYKIVSEGYLIGIKELIKEYPDYIKYKEEII